MPLTAAKGRTMPSVRDPHFELEQIAIDAFLVASASCMTHVPPDASESVNWQQLCDSSLTLNSAYMGELKSSPSLLIE